MTLLGILISNYFSSETNWFTYYRGGIAGVFLSGVILEFWNRRRKRKEGEKK